MPFLEPSKASVDDVVHRSRANRARHIAVRNSDENPWNRHLLQRSLSLGFEILHIGHETRKPA